VAISRGVFRCLPSPLFWGEATVDLGAFGAFGGPADLLVPVPVPVPVLVWVWVWEGALGESLAVALAGIFLAVVAGRATLFADDPADLGDLVGGDASFLVGVLTGGLCFFCGLFFGIALAV
jgi:hypothetical protein